MGAAAELGRSALKAIGGAELSQEPMKPPDGFKAYEDGKQRRYSLLFAVNGGAFAVAKLMHGPEPRDIGLLSPPLLSAGMILFSAFMVRDIYLFGQMMRAKYVPDAFGPAGKQLLLVIGAVICAGWALTAWR